MVRFSVKKAMTIFVAAIAIIVLGVVAFTSMTPNLLPNIDLPYVVVITAYPGATPEQVESEVTKPLEQSMATLDNVEEINSVSAENYSTLILEFATDVNMDTISIDISQKIDQLKGGWDDTVGSPYMMKMNPDMLPVVVAAVDMEGMDTTELSEFLQDTLMSDLEGISGVASVSADGIIEETINVLFDQEKIDALNESIAAEINRGFAGKEDEINDAIDEMERQQEEIDSGSESVKEGQGALAQQAGSAGSEISGKQTELTQAMSQITTQISDMKTQLAELEESRVQLEEIQAAISELEEAEFELQAAVKGLETIHATLTSLDTQMDQINRQIAAIRDDASLTEKAKEQAINTIYTSEPYLQIEAGYAVIDSQLAARGLTRESIPAGIESAKSSLLMVQSSMTAIDEALSGMGLERGDVTSSLEEISSGISQIEGAITTLESTLDGLRSGSVQLKDAMSQLEKQKISAIFELGDTSTQLLLGDATLTNYLTEAESGLAQLKDAKEAAFKSADLNNIVTLETISSILAAQNFSMPVGYVEQDGVQYMVSVGDAIGSTDEISDLMLFDMEIDGVMPVYLSDVADTFVSDNSAEVYAKINGNDGVVLSFSKQSTYATADVSDNIWQEFKKLSQEHEGLSYASLMDQGDYIYIIINSIVENLLLGALLAVVVLFVFLKDIKPTIITLVSIPISVLFALVLMYFSGVTLNMFSLSGLAVAVGMLVDNSIVVIENIYRLRNLGESPIKSAISGAAQVTSAIVSSTLTTVCVFLPIVFIEGLTRQLFSDFALTFAYALLASLIISLTLVPAMSSGMLRNIKNPKQGAFNKMLRGYSKSLGWTLRHRKTVLAIMVALLITSIGLSLSKGFSFMPGMEMDQLSATMAMPEGTTMEDTVVMSDTIIDKVEAVDGVETVGAILSGGGLLSTGTQGVTDTVSMYIILDEESERSSSEICDEINNSTKDLNCEFEVSSSLAMDMSTLTGTGVSIELYGNDLESLQKSAEAIGQRIERVEGVGEVSNGLDDTDPTIKVIVDKNRAMEQGLTVAQVYSELRGAIMTEQTATTVTYGGKDYGVLIQNDDDNTRSPDYIRALVIEVTDNQGEKKEIKLSDIADIEDAESLSAINRTNQQRYLTVVAEVKEGHNVTQVSSSVDKYLNNYNFPEGITYKMTGESESTMEAVYEVMKMLLLGVFLVYLVMVAQFQSLKDPFIVMFTIPLAFTGGFLALFIAGLDVSVMSLIGFVMLVGIIVNNGIVLVDYINQLRMEGATVLEAVKEAGTTRMRPVLMTSLTTIFGLIFMAVGTGDGAEMMQPIAIVCIGGLLYATLMTLYVVPILYSLLNRKEMRIIKEDELIISDK